jgi:hypothetical protein
VWGGVLTALAVCTRDPPHEQLLVGVGWVLVHCLSSLSPGQGDGTIVSVMWWVNEGGGAYLVGLPLDGSPSAIPPSIVVLVSLPTLLIRHLVGPFIHDSAGVWGVRFWRRPPC